MGGEDIAGKRLLVTGTDSGYGDWIELSRLFASTKQQTHAVIGLGLAGVT
jgi:hypothetical protein